MVELKDVFGKLVKAKHIFYVIDACYLGSILEKRGGAEKTDISLEYLREVTREPVRYALTAGDKGQQVLDDGPRGHSVEPAGAQIAVNGEIRGTSPLTLVDLVPGNYQVKAVQEEYEAGSVDAQVTVGELKKVSLTLKQLPAGLTVETDPSGAEVYVDGTYKGMSPLTVSSLTRGNRTVEARKNGFNIESKVLMAVGGKVTGVRMTMKASLLIETVRVESGTFQMGSTTGGSDGKPVHPVTIGKAFLIGKYEVTQKNYLDVMGTNPSQCTGDSSRPVEQVTWFEAVAFCNALSKREGHDPCYSISGTSVSCDFSNGGGMGVRRTGRESEPDLSVFGQR